MHLSTEAEVRVEIIIQCTVGDQVLRVHRTTKAFECIVAGEADHDIIDGSSVANASECKSVDLVVRLKGDSRKFYPDIPQGSRIIGVICSAIESFDGIHTAFDDFLAGRIIDRRFPQDDQSAPITIGAGADRLVGRENDRCG